MKPKSITRAFIIGAGSYGTALAYAFSSKLPCILYSIEEAVVTEINTNHTNSKYTHLAKLPDSIRATSDLKEIQQNDLIIITVPSSVVAIVCNSLKPYYKGNYVISTAKGLSPDGKVMTDVIKSILKITPQKLVALSGPSIAGELLAAKPTGVMIGGLRSSTVHLRVLLETPQVLIRRTTDIKGIQLLGFYKNIIALLIGICDGLDMGENFKAALVSKAYSEFYHLNIKKNIARHSFIEFAGLGDLYVTASSDNSRNKRFGKMIASGKSAEQIKQEIGQVVEGYQNLLLLKNLSEKKHLDVNLLNMLMSITSGSLTADQMRILLIKYLRASEIKALIFDWGNVLTQGNYSMRVADYLVKKYNKDNPKNMLVQKKLFNDLEANEKKALLGNESFADYFSHIKKLYPMMTFSVFLDAYKKSITWDKDLLAFIKQQKKRYKIYLLSNNYSVISPILRKSELKGVFDDMIFSNDVHLLKPKQDIFVYALNRFKLRPENCIFIDDTLHNVKSAEILKIHTVHYKNVKKLKEELGKIVID